MDTGKQDEFKLYPHSSKLITAASIFRIRIGNAYKVQLQLNNKPLNFDPKSKVANFTVDASGLKFIETPPKIKKH